MGESAYNKDLAATVAELKSSGIVVESQGAQVAFLQEMADKGETFYARFAAAKAA